MPRYPVSGWVEAGLYVFAIGFLSLAYVIGHQLGAHPIAFILYAMTVSAVVLLSVTGLGDDALSVILAPQSWMVGIGTIAMEVFYYQILEHVSPALGSLLVRLTIPLSMVVGWSLYGRRPARPSLIGAAIICAAIVPMLFTSAPGHRWSIVLLAFACACAYALRGFSAEFHPWNRAARTVREKLRITGLVVLVTSVAGLALAGVCSALIAADVLPATPVVPTAAQMLHGPTVLLGVFVGSIILTAMAVLNFSCVVKITTENFAATSAFTPVATLLVQLAAGALGFIPFFPIDRSLLPAMAVVILGVFLILYSARRR
jgi:hypothetical protein